MTSQNEDTVAEQQQLLQAIEDRQLAGNAFALATVVHVKGSAYRREGTKMLVDYSGQQVCTISGGCLEQAIGNLAQTVIQTGRASLHQFDLDEDVVWGLGLGCGGSIKVLLEPFDQSNAFTAWLAAVKTNQPAVLVTALDGELMGHTARMFVNAQGETQGTLGADTLDRHFAQLSVSKLQDLYPRSERYLLTTSQGDTRPFFVDVTSPLPELVIFGAGHDALPLANLAHSLGYQVTVVDARHAFVTEERFPHAKLIRSHPSGFAGQVSLGQRSYAVIMNHHLERDKACLAFALDSCAPYVGVLGPRTRYQHILQDLTHEGIHVTSPQTQRVHTPIGLDVGADSAAEIAVSIMSELLAVRGGFKAGFLTNREGRIHEPV
ncbi:MAG: XdhC family protein [Deinococcota bacterium]